MLKGTLDDFTLPDIFRLLSQSQKTGRLDVERSAGRGNVFFKDGTVYFAESTLSRELVGQKLLKAKVLSDGQLMKALDEQAESGGRVGEVLLGSGLVTEEQLERALRGQVEDAVFDLLRWDAGEFDWVPGETTDAEISLSVSVENLIMEGSRRLDEMAIITRKIPSEHSLVEMAPTPPVGAAEINITPDEWRVLVLVNGQRTVLDIAEATGTDVFAAMRTLYGLAAAGLVHVPGHVMEDDAELPPLPPEPVAYEAPAPSVHEPVNEMEQVETPPEQIDVQEPEATAEPVAEDELVAVDPEEAAPEPVTHHVDAYAPDATYELDEMDLLGPAADSDGTDDTDDDAGDDAETAAPLEATDLPTSEWFDAPEPGDIMAEEPAEASAGEVGGTDPFVAEILAPLEASEEADHQPVAEIDLPFDGAPETQFDGAPETEFEGSSNTEPAPDPVGGPSANGQDRGPEHTVDKRDAVRELSDLFKQTEVDSRPTFIVPEVTEETTENGHEAPDEESRHRVEDDEEITRGLISRLIDGVKGL